MSKKQEITYLKEESEDSVSKQNKLKRAKKQLRQCQKEKEEYLIQAQRARADLINYQKRQERLIQELKSAGQAKIIFDLLPFIDSLYQAAKSNQEINYLKKQLDSILKNHQIKEIKAEGEKFNPDFHEAIDQVETDIESGTVVEEVQTGYLLGDKLLRPSKVRVAK